MAWLRDFVEVVSKLYRRGYRSRFRWWRGKWREIRGVGKFKCGVSGTHLGIWPKPGYLNM